MTVFPSSPRKAKTRKTRRRRILVDRMTQLSPDVIKRNVHSGGQETLCERVSSNINHTRIGIWESWGQ